MRTLKYTIMLSIIAILLFFTIKYLLSDKKEFDESLYNSEISSQIESENSNPMKDEEQSDQQNETITLYETPTEFWNDVEGFWYSDENMTTSFTFDEETNEPKFITGLMESSASLAGTAKFIDTTDTDNYYRLMINCPAVVYDDRVQSQEKDVFIYIDISELDKQILTIRSHTGETAKWVYAGANFDELYTNLEQTKANFNNI